MLFPKNLGYYLLTESLVDDLHCFSKLSKICFIQFDFGYPIVFPNEDVALDLYVGAAMGHQSQHFPVQHLH